MTWQPGRQEIHIALGDGNLQRVTGGQAAAKAGSLKRDASMKRRGSSLTPIRSRPTSPPMTRPVSPLFGVLAQQGLRATESGGHLAVEHAVRAQFGNSFAPFATLRRRRAELEYLSFPGEKVDEELLDALRTIQQIIDGAAELLPHLSIFTDT